MCWNMLDVTICTKYAEISKGPAALKYPENQQRVKYAGRYSGELRGVSISDSKNVYLLKAQPKLGVRSHCTNVLPKGAYTF